MSILSQWAICFILGLSMGGAGAWKVQNLRHDAAELAAKKAADAKEQNWRDDSKVAEDVNREEQDAVHASHLSDLARLRDKFERLSKAPGSACNAASTPTIALSEQSASRVIAIGADADTVAADLRTCQAYVKAVTAR